jgi:carbonic anhydrase
MALAMGAHAAEHGDAHGDKADAAEHAEPKEGASKASLKPNLKAAAKASESRGSEVRGSVEKEASRGKEAGASKLDSKAESAPEGKASVSMSELRDMIDKKIAEVRSERDAPPVVRLRPKSKPATAPKRPKPAPAAEAGSGATHDEDGALLPVGAVGGMGGEPQTEEIVETAPPVVSRAPAPAPAPRAAHAAAARAAAAKAMAARMAAAPSHSNSPNPHGQDVHWAYSGDTGPDSWGRLKPEFQQCMLGKRQSPIDIRDGIPVQLDPIQFDYRPSGFRVIDNGHTVQVNVDPGNSIIVHGHRYELQQFHFHRPSEERINGRQYEMVAHLVHKDADGKLAVVAVLLDQGKAHPLVQQVWNNLPLEKGMEQASLTQMDLTQLLPEQRQYYTYMGSLTTPPCSEGVLWMVMKNPAMVSREQIGVFGKLYQMNARPIQSTSGRLIKDGQ